MDGWMHRQTGRQTDTDKLRTDRKSDSLTGTETAVGFYTEPFRVPEREREEHQKNLLQSKSVVCVWS